MDNTKIHRQSAFWQSMIDKYSQRKSQLQEQQCQLQHRLEAMECSMPAALLCKMNRREFGEVDITKFMSQLGRPSVASVCPPCSTQRTPFPPQQASRASLDLSNCPCSPCVAKARRQSSTVPKPAPKKTDLCVCVTGIKPEAKLEESSTCSCNPCAGPAESSVKSGDTTCSCNPCPNIESSINGSTCSCNPCSYSTMSNRSDTTCVCGKESSMGNQGSVCPCDPCANAPEAVLTTDYLCTCNPCTDANGLDADESAESDITCICSAIAKIQNEPAPNDNSCTCPSSMVSGSNSTSCPCSTCVGKASLQSGGSCICSQSTHSADIGKLSLFSLQSADLQLMGNLQNLVAQEKLMKQQIQEMQHREQAYLNTLKKADEMWGCMEENYKQRLSNAQQNGNDACAKFEKMNEQLMEENSRLSDELKDIKLELKQCLERVKGPLDRQLEKERRKSEQLENELMYTSKSIADKECKYIKEMSLLQNQLNSTCQNLCEVNSVNEQLKQEMCMLKCKYNQLQKDLINQKLSEAHNLEHLQELFCLERAAMGDQAKDLEKKEPELKCEDESLYTIARKLSKTLAAADKCGTCKTLPCELTDTVKEIKSIVDLIDRRRKKSERSRESSKSKRLPPKPDVDEEGGQRRRSSTRRSFAQQPTEDKSAAAFIKESRDIGSQGDREECTCLTESFAQQPTEDEGVAAAFKEPGEAEVGGEAEGEGEIGIDTAASEAVTERERSSSIKKSIEKSSTQSSRPSSTRESIRRSSAQISKGRVSIQEPLPAEVSAEAPLEYLVDAMESFKESLASVSREIEIITEIEAPEDTEVEVETEVNLYETFTDGINITTTITGSGTLEVITEGPAGVIETILTYSESGNIEVTTEVTEYPDFYDSQVFPERLVEEGYSQLQLEAPESSAFGMTSSSSSRMSPSAISPRTTSSSRPTTISAVSTLLDTTATRPSKAEKLQIPTEQKCFCRSIEIIDKTAEAEAAKISEEPLEAKETVEGAEGEGGKEEVGEKGEGEELVEVGGIEGEGEEEEEKAGQGEGEVEAKEGEEEGKEGAEEGEEGKEGEEAEVEEEKAGEGEVVEGGVVEEKEGEEEVEEKEEEKEEGEEGAEEGKEDEEETGEEGKQLEEETIEAGGEEEGKEDATIQEEQLREGEIVLEIQIEETEAAEIPEDQLKAVAEVEEVAIEIKVSEGEAVAEVIEATAAEVTEPTAVEMGGEKAIKDVGLAAMVEGAAELTSVAAASAEAAESASETETTGIEAAAGAVEAKESDKGAAAEVETLKDLGVAEKESKEEPAGVEEAGKEAISETGKESDVIAAGVMAEVPSTTAKSVEEAVLPTIPEEAVAEGAEVMKPAGEAISKESRPADAIEAEKVSPEEAEESIISEIERPQTPSDTAETEIIATVTKDAAIEAEQAEIIPSAEQAGVVSEEVSISEMQAVESMKSAITAESKVTLEGEEFVEATEMPSIHAPSEAEEFAEVPETLSAVEVPSETEPFTEAADVMEVKVEIVEEGVFETAGGEEVPSVADFQEAVGEEQPSMYTLSEETASGGTMPYIPSADRCKDICSPAYQKEQEEVCKDICAMIAKGQLPGSKYKFKDARSSQDMSKRSSKIESRKSASRASKESSRRTSKGSVTISEKQSEGSRRASFVSIDEKRSEGSKKPSMASISEQKSEGSKRPSVTSEDKLEGAGSAGESARQSVGSGEDKPSSIRTSVTSSEQASLDKRSSRRSSQTEEVKSSRRSSAAMTEEAEASSKGPSEGEGEAERVSTGSKGSRRSSGIPVPVPSSLSGSEKLIVADELHVRLSHAEQRLSLLEDKISLRGRSGSKIPIPTTARRSKLAEIKCDCQKCDCLICSPDIMKQRMEQKAQMICAKPAGRPDDCTCLPECVCARCAQKDADMLRPSDTPKQSGTPRLSGSPRQSGTPRLSKSICLDRQSKEVEKLCYDPIAKHPIDCDCVDCLCDPCGPEPPEERPKAEHGPACNCLSCLCNPCAETDTEICGHPRPAPGSRKFTMEPSSPASKRPSAAEEGSSRRGSCTGDASRPLSKPSSRRPSALHSLSKERYVPPIRKHPPNCHCVICSCAVCKEEKPEVTKEEIEQKQEEEQQQEVEKEEGKGQEPEPCQTPAVPQLICTKCLCSETVAAVQPYICEKCVAKQEPQKPQSGDSSDAHPSDCACMNCVLVCNDVCTDIQPPQPPPEETLALPELSDQPPNLSDHPPDCSCIECTCSEASADMTLDQKEPEDDVIESRIKELENESLERQKEMSELQNIIQQIKCACQEAEIQSKAGKKTDASGNTISGLQLALQALQSKCKEKDLMIEAIIKELKIRANSKIFDSMLQQLAAAQSAEVAIDYNRTEICKFLPRPTDPDPNSCTCETQPPPLPKPSKMCKPRKPSDDENAREKKDKPPKKCQHQNYPNCPCTAEEASKPPTPPRPSKPSMSCPHIDGRCHCKTQPAELQEASLEQPQESPAADTTCPCNEAEEKAENAKKATRPPSPKLPSSRKSSGKKAFTAAPCKETPSKKRRSQPKASGRPKSASSYRKKSKCISDEEKKFKSDVPLAKKAQKLSVQKASYPEICMCAGFPAISPSITMQTAINSEPIEITEMRRIPPDSLLIKWQAPASKHVTGYEILVDGITKSRVHSSKRTSAVLHSLLMKESLNISIFATTAAGRCQPPGNAIFQVQ